MRLFRNIFMKKNGIMLDRLVHIRLILSTYDILDSASTLVAEAGRLVMYDMAIQI